MFTLLYCIFKSKHHQVSVNNKPFFSHSILLQCLEEGFIPTTLALFHICYLHILNWSELDWDYMSWVYSRFAYTIKGVWVVAFCFKICVQKQLIHTFFNTWEKYFTTMPRGGHLPKVSYQVRRALVRSVHSSDKRSCSLDNLVHWTILIYDPLD